MKKLTFILLSFFIFMTGCAQKKDIQLPAPHTTGGMPLMEVLKNRHTMRDFSEKELDLQTLSNLLWSAFGYNRLDEKKRTAPSARNKQEIEIYCALPKGLYLWNPEKNVLQLVIEEDIRVKTGGQDFVASAPLNLIYVCNNEKLDGEVSDAQRNMVYVDAGFISENVYLYCTSSGLSTVVRGYFDPVELSTTMQLPKNKWIVITQTVGFPK